MREWNGYAEFLSQVTLTPQTSSRPPDPHPIQPPTAAGFVGS